MAKIVRYPGNLKSFAADAIGTERTVFGDTAQSDLLADNVNADFFRGWGIIGPSDVPTKQDFNGLAFTLGQILSYLHQMGIAEWQTAQEYPEHGICIGSDGIVYRSLVNANIGNDPTTDAVNWVQMCNATDTLYDGSANGLPNNVQAAIASIVPMGLEWKNGLLVSNNSTDAEHDIDVAAGQIMDDTNTYRMNCQAITKRGDAVFSAGTGNGGLASGDVALANNTWYGFFKLQVAATANNPATSDMVIATTRARALASTGVAGVFDICRLVGCGLTDGSANFIAFVDGGDGWNVWSSKIDSTNDSGSDAGAAFTVSVPPFMLGSFTYGISITATTAIRYGLLTQVDQENSAASATMYDVIAESGGSDPASAAITKFLKADGSSQIRHRESANFILDKIFTNAWRFLPTVTDLV